MTPRPSIKSGTDHTGDSIEPAPYTSRFVEAGGLRLHYLDYGTAGRPPMLCLHGGAAHAHWFDFVAAGFTSDYHVRALDQRGHGDSAWVQPPAYTYEDYASDLAQVVDKLDLRDFVLLGHSMGGMVSLVYAATHPGRVARLVVVDTTMRMAEERLAAMREVGNRQGGRYATREEFVARFRLRPPGTTTAPAIMRHLAQNSGRQGDDGGWRHKFDRSVYAMRPSLDGVPYWSRISVPALLVKGARSERITPQIFAEVRARCPHVELAEVAASDHHVTLDNPAGFAQAVRAFLAKHRRAVE
ncbi:MAG: alpha/beta hydrolase [Betaproteobacteria bacterium]|nr:alpha/beta hydrolase [Betaproteobacteria bacterium]